ncbi:MAG: LysE family transporter [Proteobacteria bacterium]|nr:LysE family transporter [Pseudomonadota bacterium]
MMVYLNGLTLGLSLVTALGPQNIFLIRQGAKRNHAVLSALICFLCDMILVTASVAGLHKALEARPSLQVWLTWFGVLFLFYYGFSALKRAIWPTLKENIEEKQRISKLQIIALALGFSLLNPHAIIDSLVIIGGGSSQFPGQQYAFLLGVITSSFIWLSSLTLTTHYFADLLARDKIWRNIELASGLLMIFLSFKLGLSQL